MKTLTGSEKQINWANEIRNTVLKYLAIEKAATNKRYQTQLAADPTDADEEAKPLRLKLQRLSVVEKFLNEQTDSSFFINNLKNYSKYRTFENFVETQKKPLTDEQANVLYRIYNEQCASDCYSLLEEVCKNAMKENNFFSAARNEII
jgi:hypothetical protein